MTERNYAEDQANEIEALDSIYCGELEILSSEPHKFRLPIATEEFDPENEEDSGLKCFLCFTYSDKYPDTAPIVEIEDSINFSGSYEEKLLGQIKTTIEENLGMEMVFSVVSSAQEWLNVQWDKRKEDEETAREMRLKEEEEKEMKKFEGTRVTIETFLKWRTEFELDTGITDKKLKEQSESQKLTGKELFLRDNTLNESDLKFLLDAGDSIENVKIDESLFQNLDDLELGSDDESDDDDWVPGKD